MKLYTQNGRWVGTQLEAKREFGEITLVDVPTDKQALLDWLNEHNVGGASPQRHATSDDISPTVAVSPTTSTKPHAWQTIRECAERASLKDLGIALAVLMNRLEEIADRVE